MDINLNLGRGGLLAIFLLVVSVGVIPVTGSSTSQPTQRTRVATRPHTVTVDGQTESVNSTIRIPSGDTLSISPDLKPSFYYLEIYHESHRLEKLPIAGNKTYRYQIPNSASGEYIVALEKHTGKLINVTDVTVSRYSITTTVPVTQKRGSSVQLSASVTPAVSNSNATKVEFTIEHGGNWEYVPAEQKMPGQYATTTTMSESGEYQIHALIENKSAENGSGERIGVSGSKTLLVNSNSTAQNQTTQSGSSQSTTSEIRSTPQSTIHSPSSTTERTATSPTTRSTNPPRGTTPPTTSSKQTQHNSNLSVATPSSIGIFNLRWAGVFPRSFVRKNSGIFVALGILVYAGATLLLLSILE